MHYNGIIFDFNGTLFFDTDLHVQAWDQISFELTGKHLTKQDLLTKYWGLPNADLIHAITNHTLTDTECMEISRKKEALYRSIAKSDRNSVLAPGAIDFFIYLNQHNIPFTIATASIKENVDFYIHHFHLDQYMDTNTIVFDDGNYKSKYQMYQQAIQNIHNPSHTVIFEDSINGVLAANHTGSKVIAIQSDELKTRLEYIPNLVSTIHDFQNITHLLDNLSD